MLFLFLFPVDIVSQKCLRLRASRPCLKIALLCANHLKLYAFSYILRLNQILAQILIIPFNKHFVEKRFLRTDQMMKQCDESIKKTLKLTDKMIDLADEGDAMREDSGCGILYGVLRDSAFKIRQLAESERDAHIKKGWWK